MTKHEKYFENRYQEDRTLQDAVYSDPLRKSFASVLGNNASITNCSGKFTNKYLLNLHQVLHSITLRQHTGNDQAMQRAAENVVQQP